MLVDKDYANILPLFREFVECVLNRRLLCLVVDYKEIPLRIRRFCDVTNTGEK